MERVLRVPRYRIVVFLFAAFQLGFSTAVPIADALLEGASAAMPLHVEAAGETPCAPGHDHLFCQLCRTLTLVAPPSTGGSRYSALPSAGLSAPRADDHDVASTVDRSGPLGPRAPPHA
jgi:hypothetical protein